MFDDSDDSCLNAKETQNGIDDGDGCPDDGTAPDSDGDGVSDAKDKCPDQAEVWNKFADSDGCPDALPGGAKNFPNWRP